MPKITPRREGGKIATQNTGPRKGPDGGGTYSAEHRFSNHEDMRSRYSDIRSRRGSMMSWQSIVKQYDRHPYKDERGMLKSNFGQMRYKVDQALTTYVDFATERETWAAVTTTEGFMEGNSKVWSDEISGAFQKFCIKRWKKSAWEVMMSAKDMLLFSNGILGWDDAYGTLYPESIDTACVWPEPDSGQFPEDWGLVFFEKRFKAWELYEKVEDPEVAEANGWSREKVLELVREGVPGLANEMSLESVFDCFRLGTLAADDRDHIIPVVFAYVREYREKDGNYVSRLCFSEEKNSTGYLMEKRHCIKGVAQRFRVLNTTPARKYYESTSFAQLIYVTSKQYDIIMNRILEALEDNMRVFLKVQTQDQLDKIQKMRVGMWQGLIDVDLVQERVQRPVKEASEVLRMVMIDQNVGTGQYMVGEQSQQGGAKTATQSEIDLSESTRISSAHLKMFNLFFSLVLEEIYRRFTTAERGYPHYEDLKRFERYLKSKGVPPSAWQFENVQVESVLSMGAGSPAVKVRSGQAILATLATPARTPGERQAKRDIIAALKGVENVDAYIPREEDLNVPEDSLIGLENEAMLSPTANPSNTPVHPDHLHMRHVPRHIASMSAAVGIAEAMFQARQQMNPDDEGVILKTIADTLIGVDNIGAHTQAHLIVAGSSRDKGVKLQLQGFSNAIQEINRRQDKLEHILDEVQQKRVEEARQRNGYDPELAHLERKYKLEEEHQANMMALQFRDSKLKGEQLRSNSADNARLKNSLQVEGARTKAETDRIAAQSKANKPGSGKNGSRGS